MNDTEITTTTSWEPEQRRRQLLLAIHHLTQQEQLAIELNDWQELARLRAQKRADMEQVDRISEDLGEPGPACQEIIERIALLARANSVSLEKKMEAVRGALDEISDTRRRLATLRKGYGRAEQRAVCLDKSA